MKAPRVSNVEAAISIAYQEGIKDGLKGEPCRVAKFLTTAEMESYRIGWRQGSNADMK